MLFFSILYSGTAANAQCPVVTVTPTISCGGVAGAGGPCTPLTASGNADIYLWSPLAGLYTNCSMTTPYTGTNTTVVYAAPTSYTIYTVTGTIIASGCSRTATARVNYTPPAPIVTPNPVVMCLGSPAIKLKAGIPPASSQFCSGPINIPVPDNNPAGGSNNIAVSGLPATAPITRISVTINMAHTRIGNMVFVLKAPNGEIINLDYHLNSTGGNGATTGFNGTRINSDGINSLNTGVDPYTSIFRADLVGPGGIAGFGAGGPTGMLPTTLNWSSLILIPNGNWTLGFYDGVTGDVGTLTSWCIEITQTMSIPATPAVWSPIAGLYSNSTATIPYIAGVPIDSVWARPVPPGIYPYQATVSSLPVPPFGFTNPAALTIPMPGPIGGIASIYPFDLTVSGLPNTGVRVSSVVLHGVTHTRSNDIDVLLQSPTGQNVILMSDVGSSSANATYTFMDSGPPMNITGANMTGTYRPTNAEVSVDNWPAPGPGAVTQSTPTLASFSNVASVNGLWRLYVFDDNGPAEQGLFAGGYTINFDIGAIACNSAPTTVVVTVGQPFSIVTQPVNRTICTDAVANFTVVVSGGGTLNYQWQVSSNGGSTYINLNNGGFYSGATTATLTVTAPPVSMNGYYYRVLVSGTAVCASATSTAAILTVNPLPDIVITANPIIIGPTQTTTIFSTVTPNPAATYTWYYNNSVLPGAVSSSLLVSYGSPGDYQLEVTDVNGCTNLSNIITIANSFALNIYTYPNPSGGIFQVRYFSEPNSTLQRSLTVYNNMGDRILTRTFTQTIPYQIIDVDVRAHGKGLYWLELRDANGKRLAMKRAVVQ